MSLSASCAISAGSAPPACGCENCSAGVAADLVARPLLRQRLALRHEIDRAGRLRLHDGVGAAQRLLHHDAGRQRPFPFHVGPHQRALVDRLLHEVHVGVARADQLVARGVGRLARHQQHRQAAAEQVVHRVGGVGGADVDVHQHGLAAAGHRRIAHRHMRRGVLVRAEHHVRHLLAALLPVRHRLDGRRVVGAEVAEQVLDAELVQALDEVVGGGVLGRVADLRGGGGVGRGLGHGCYRWFVVMAGMAFLGPYFALSGRGDSRLRLACKSSALPPPERGRGGVGGMTDRKADPHPVCFASRPPLSGEVSKSCYAGTVSAAGTRLT